jgi:Cof subfamily protein (haloacid dehalogenase superfamily)
MSGISVIALDIDGTLLRTDHHISTATKSFLQSLSPEEYQVILVTGRHHQMAQPIYRELALTTPLICANGAYTYDFSEQRIVAGQPLSGQQWHYLAPLIQSFDLEVICHCTTGLAFISGNNRVRRLFQRFAVFFPDQVPTFYEHKSLTALHRKRGPIWKLELQHNNPQAIEQFMSHLSDHVAVQAYRTDPYSVEISPKPSSKFHALNHWLGSQGLSAEQAAAFGDNLNDLEMLRGVGVGIAMGNAASAAKEAARYTTLTNDEDGIVYGLKNWVLG